MWGVGGEGGAASPAWEDKTLTAYSPAARTKVINKKIHLNVHQRETIVNWEIVRMKKIRFGIGWGCRGEGGVTRNCHFWFSPTL